MAAGPITQVSDVVVPEIFTPYVQQMTETKSRLIASGAVVRDPSIDALLAGGGLTFNVPSWQDLDDDAERVGTDTPHAEFTGGVAEPDPQKIGTGTEIAVRCNRNQSWSSAPLAAQLAGDDPMDAIASRVSAYWTRRSQAMFMATMTGIFADNAAVPGGTEHVQNDLTNDISGVYTPGVTDFSAEAFIDTALTMGDSMDDLGLVFMHSVVYARAQKNNLIDFIPDAAGVVNIPTFLGRIVIVDDGMPAAAGIYETWLFGAGAIRWGVGSADVPTAVERKEGAGNGQGQEVLYNRVVWSMHPVGHAYVGTAANGGPSNAATANNLGNAGSFQRIYPERKQIKIARLITTES